MDSKDIFDGVTDIRDDLIAGAKSPARKKKRARPRWMGAVAAVLVLAVALGIALRPGLGLNAYAVAEAEYPDMAQYPVHYTDKAYAAWREDVDAQRRDLGDVSAMQDFFKSSTAVFLSGGEGENRVYSPLNVYMALAMLARITDGESRGQILSLLGSGSMDALTKQANDVWNANYRDDGTYTSILASSLWLSEDIEYDRETLDALAEDFYASAYRGEMGSEGFDDALRQWLNRQTGGLLKEQAEKLSMDPRTILALATTVYFKAKWADEFSESVTAPRTFHSPDGDLEVDFMYQSESRTYYWGEKFSAISLGFEGGGRMWFILPDEGVTPEELLSDSEAMDFLCALNQWENKKGVLVNEYIPKFDVSSDFDLIEGLEELGVTDVFDFGRADFSPLTTLEDAIAVTSAEHAARVTIDEEGCTAAAFTVLMQETGAAMPPDEEVDFVLDRPFIFSITGDSGLPLFTGIVNHPIG